MGTTHAPGRDEEGPAPTSAQGPPLSVPGLLALQRAAGNAAVSQQVQRYAVGVPAKADYATLMAWMTSSNPYAPDAAAYTEARFSYTAPFKATGEAGSWTVTVTSAATVAVKKKVDMPVWASADPKLQAAWKSGIAALRTHEGEHEKLADTWQATLLGRVKGFTFSSTAGDETAAGAEADAALKLEWKKWIAEHDAAQKALDPYLVTVKDPYPAAPAPTPAPAPADADADAEEDSD